MRIHRPLLELPCAVPVFFVIRELQLSASCPSLTSSLRFLNSVFRALHLLHCCKHICRHLKFPYFCVQNRCSGSTSAAQKATSAFLKLTRDTFKPNYNLQTLLQSAQALFLNPQTFFWCPRALFCSPQALLQTLRAKAHKPSSEPTRNNPFPPRLLTHFSLTALFHRGPGVAGTAPSL